VSEPVEGGVLLLSTRPEARELMLRSFRDRGVPVAVSSERACTLAHLLHPPALVLVDLHYAGGLDRDSIGALNHLREKSMVLGIHEGNLEPVAKPLDALVVNAYCHARNWRTIVDLASSALHSAANAFHH
jgi:CheY-like chemotaxis protein